MLRDSILNVLAQWLVPSRQRIDSRVPIGFTGQGCIWFTDTAPNGWLICDGSLVKKADYPDLWLLLGDTWGASTTDDFYLPDLRGRVPVGHDATQTEFDALGESGGAKTHTLTIAEMPSHDHTTAWRPFMPNGTGSLALNDRGGDAILVSDNAAHGGNGENLGNTSSIVNNTGSGTAHNNLQPYRVVNYIIKF